jgi:hypothetical protein
MASGIFFILQQWTWHLWCVNVSDSRVLARERCYTTGALTTLPPSGYFVQDDPKLPIHLQERRYVSRGEDTYDYNDEGMGQGHTVTWHTSHVRHLGRVSAGTFESLPTSNTCYSRCIGTFESPCTVAFNWRIRVPARRGTNHRPGASLQGLWTLNGLWQ